MNKNYSKNPENDAVLLALKAEMFKQKGNFKKAINMLTKAIVFDDKNDTIYYSRAVVYFYAKKYKLALKDIEKWNGFKEIMKQYDTIIEIMKQNKQKPAKGAFVRRNYDC